MILLIDSSYKRDSLSLREFVHPIRDAIEKSCLIRHYTSVEEEDLKSATHIIICGTALMDNASLEDMDLFSWLKSVEKPVLGICAGMQAIGKAFGCPIIRQSEIGMTQIRTTGENPFLDGDTQVYAMHSLCVEESSQIRPFAESESCIHGIQVKGRDIFGLLFHPEVRHTEMLRKFVATKGW